MIARDIVRLGKVVKESGAPRRSETFACRSNMRRAASSGCSRPQANTTVEPEFNLLWPPGVAMINARLMSDKATMTARLVDYFANYDASLRQFANAPVGVAAAACTGASYLAGREREAELVRHTARPHRLPLRHGGAGGRRRAGCVAGEAASASCRPIRRSSTAPASPTGESHGFELCEMANVFEPGCRLPSDLRLAGSSAIAALRSLEGKPLDAIVMLGTGMPTLAPIASAIGWNGAPVMSCNLCLAWRVVEVLDREAPRA